MTDRRIEVLQMIQKDVEQDIYASEGKPFTGRNVHILFGQQAAAIKSLAEIVETLIPKEVE